MRKIIAFLFAVAVAFTVQTDSYAFVPQKIKSMREDSATRIWDIQLDGEEIEASELSNITVHPLSELEIALAGKGEDADLFLDQNGVTINTADVTISRMRAADVAVKVEAVMGGVVVKDAELTVRNTGAAAKPVIRLVFPDECPNLDPIDFSAELCVLIDGEEQYGSRVGIAGVFGNPETEIDSGDMMVSAGLTVLVAKEDIPLVSIDAGAGVFVDASMRAGRRYLVTAESSRDARDLALIRQSSGVTSVIRLKSSGFEPEEIKSVRIESEHLLQAYDEYGRRLGNTSQKLPYAEKYYLSDKAVSF